MLVLTADWCITPYTLALLFATGLSAMIVVIAWRRRHTPGGAPLAWLMLAITQWALSITIEVSAISQTSKILWSKISYLGIQSVPLLMVAFTLAYVHQSAWLTRRRLVLLAIVPAITLFLAFTNEQHGLIWPGFSPGLEGTNLLIYHHGPWKWVSVVYIYLVLLACTVLLAHTYLQSRFIYRRQVGVLLIGIAIPWISSVVYMFDLSPLPGLDTTTLAFSATGAVFAWGLFRLRMVDLLPVARSEVIERMGEGVLILDDHDRIVDANPHAEILIGQVRHLVGKHIGEALASRSDLEVILDHGSKWGTWQDLIALSHEPTETRAEIVLTGRMSRYLDVRISPLLDQRGGVRGGLFVWRDITERRQAQETLQHYAVELEQRNQDLDAFAHSVAHDLKNPLNLIVGYAELVRAMHDRLSNKDLTDNLETITAQAYHMSHIIDGLLLLSSVRHAHDVSSEPLDMDAIVATVCARLSQVIATSGAEVRLPADWPQAVGYPVWVEEVWANYLENAIKYGGQPPRIELGWNEVDATGAYRFWVRDNGRGLTPEEQARLFAPFTRLNVTAQRGHGLGLSIVKRIATKLNGTAGVESVPGQGSRFWFTLPATDERITTAELVPAGITADHHIFDLEGETL